MILTRWYCFLDIFSVTFASRIYLVSWMLNSLITRIHTRNLNSFTRHRLLSLISSTKCRVKPTNSNLWSLYFDNSKSKYGIVVGCLLIDLHGNRTWLSCQLESKCSDNMVDYEALLQGLRKSIDLNVKCIEVFGDFEEVIKQVRNFIGCNSYHLEIYQQEVWNLMYKFEAFIIKSIPHILNFDNYMLTNATSDNDHTHNKFSIELICRSSTSDNNWGISYDNKHTIYSLH